MPSRSLHDALPHGQPREFKIELKEKDIEELKYKLDNARWGPQEGLLPDDDPGQDAGLLPTPSRLKDFAKKWRSLDFARLETALNRYQSFLVDIDWCKPLHYVYKRSKRSDAIPLVIIHGWPSCFYEFQEGIEKLTEPDKAEDPAFHVVIPSLPGCLYSKGPPSRKQGIGEVDGYSHVIDTLMTSVLGFTSYAATAGDWGSVHARCLGSKFCRPDGKTGCRAVHLTFSPIVPPGGMALAAVFGTAMERAAQILPGREAKNLTKMMSYQKNMAYYIIQQSRPQQLGPALTDSPIGLLAWITFFYEYYIERPSANQQAGEKALETMLALCTLYFITTSAATSTLLYHNNRLLPDIHADAAYKVHNGATLGYSNFPNELINVTPFWLGKTGDLRFYADAPSGGHYSCMDEPEIFANHLKVAFTPPLDGTAEASGARSWTDLLWGAKPQQTAAQALDASSRRARGIEHLSVAGTLWTTALPSGGIKR